MLINNTHISDALGVDFREAGTTFANVCKYVTVVQRKPKNNPRIKFIGVKHFDLDEAIEVIGKLPTSKTRVRDLARLREVKTKLS
jgi:hypothetical protein